MKKFKPITDDELAAMTEEEKFLAASGMHLMLHDKFHDVIDKVMKNGIFAAEAANRDPSEIVIVLAVKDDPAILDGAANGLSTFFTDEARARWTDEHNAYCVYREAFVESTPYKDKNNKYHDHWKEAAETIDDGLKLLVVAYGCASVITIRPLDPSYEKGGENYGKPLPESEGVLPPGLEGVVPPGTPVAQIG